MLLAVECGQLRKRKTPARQFEIAEKSFTIGLDFVTLLYGLDYSTVDAFFESQYD